MKTRRQREIQAAEGVPLTPPQSLEARTRRGGSRTGTRTGRRAPTSAPTHSRSNPVDLTISERSEHGDSQPESTHPRTRSRAPQTRARAGKSITRAQSKAASRAASRAPSRATSRATTAEATQLGSSQAEAIQIDSTESDPSEPDRSVPEPTEAEYNQSEPTLSETPSEPDQPFFIKAELVDDGAAQSGFIQSEPSLFEPPHLESAQSEPPRLEPARLGSSRVDAIQIDSTETEPSEPDRSDPRAPEAEHNGLEHTPSEPDQSVFIKAEFVDDGTPARPGSIQSEPPRLESPQLAATQVEAPRLAAHQVEAPQLAAYQVEAPQLAAPHVEAPRLESFEFTAPQPEATQVEAPRLEIFQFAAPQVEAPRLESPQAGPSQPTTSLTPNIDDDIKLEFAEHESNPRKRRYEDTLLYDLRARNAEADQKRQKLGKPKASVKRASAKYELWRKRRDEERKAKSAETSTPEETTQTDDPGPSEDDGSTARTSPENAPARAATATGPRNTDKEDDELAHRVSLSKKPPISSATIEDPVELALETSRARQVRKDEFARTQLRLKAKDAAALRLQAEKAAAHPVHAGQDTAHPVPAASQETAAVVVEPSQAPQQVTQDPLPPANKVTFSGWVERGVARLRNIPPGERTAKEAADLKHFEDRQANIDGPEWRPTAPTAIISQPYEGEVTLAHVDFVEPSSRANYAEQLKLRIRQEVEARAALAQAPRPPSLEAPALAIHNWPQASDETRHTLVKFCVSPRLAAECDPSFHVDKHPLSLAVDDDVFLDLMHFLAIHPKTRHGVLYELRNIHQSVKAGSERMIDYDDPDSCPPDSLASKLFAASRTRGTRNPSQPDRPHNLRTTSRASKPPASKRRQALAEVDAQSHMEQAASSQTKPDRRIVRMPKYFTGPMDNRTVLRDHSQQDVPLIESDNMSSDDESMLDLNEDHEEDVEMGNRSDQHLQGTGGPTTPTTQATPAATAQTTKSRGWGFGSLLPSAARTVSKFLPSWRQQPASLPPSPTQQAAAAPATEPRQRQHVSATQGQGRIARRNEITHSAIAREPNGAVRLMTKGAIGTMKQKAENRKTLERRAKRAEQEKAEELARKEKEKQDITKMKDNVIASLQKQLHDAKRGVISDNPANWPRPRDRVPKHAQEETLAGKDGVIRSLHRQLQAVQGGSREDARHLRGTESNQGQPVNLTRSTPLGKQKRKRVPSPEIIPNPVANGFGMDLNYFGFDDDDSQYFDDEGADHESSPLTSKRQRTLDAPATDKAVAPLNDTATESINLDMTPRPSPPVGNRYRATPYTGRIFSVTSELLHLDPLDSLFNEDPISDQAAEQQVTTSNEPQTRQPNSFTVPFEQSDTEDEPQVLFEQSEIGDEPQVSQPNTFTVPSETMPSETVPSETVPSETVPSEQPANQNEPQVSRPNTFAMPWPRISFQDTPQVTQPLPQAPTRQQSQSSQPNIFTMLADQGLVQEQPPATKPNPFLSMSSLSFPLQAPGSQPSTSDLPTVLKQVQVTKPNPFLPMSSPSFSPPTPGSQPSISNVPAIQEQPEVTKPNPFSPMASPSVTTQDKLEVSKRKKFDMPGVKTTVQEEPPATRPNPFLSVSFPSVLTQEKPQVSKSFFSNLPAPSFLAQPPTGQPNISNVPAEQATVKGKAVTQEQPRVTKANPFLSTSPPSVLTQDKPEVSKPFFSSLPAPSFLAQPPTGQPNISNVPAEQATVKEKAVTQEQPRVTKANPFPSTSPPSVLTQGKPQASKPFFSNLPPPSVLTQDEPEGGKTFFKHLPISSFLSQPSTGQQTAVQEQAQVTKPNPFLSTSSPSFPPQAPGSQTNIFNVPAQQAPVNKKAAMQEQPQGIKPNPPSVSTQDKPQVSKQFFSNLPAPSFLAQPPTGQQTAMQEQAQVTKPNPFPLTSSPSFPPQAPRSQTNIFNVPAQQAPVNEKAAMQAQPQGIKPNPPSVLTQDKPQVSKPFFSNLPSPSSSSQPQVSQPNTSTVPSPGAIDSDFSIAEPPTVSSPKALSPLKASQASPTPAEKQPAPVEKQPTPTEKQPTPVEKQPTPAEKQPASTKKQPAPVEKQPASTKKQPAPAEKQTAPAEKQPVSAEEQPAPATPLPGTPSDISLARQREQALKYAAKTPSRLHEATRPSSTNVESEGSDDQPGKSLATLAPAPVTAPTTPQATGPYPSVFLSTRTERYKKAEKKMIESGVIDYLEFINSDESTQEDRDVHKEMREEHPELLFEATLGMVEELDLYMVWGKTNPSQRVLQRPHQGPLTRRNPKAGPRLLTAGPVAAETSRPAEKAQATTQTPKRPPQGPLNRPSPEPAPRPPAADPVVADVSPPVEPAQATAQPPERPRKKPLTRRGPEPRPRPPATGPGMADTPRPFSKTQPKVDVEADLDFFQSIRPPVGPSHPAVRQGITSYGHKPSDAEPGPKKGFVFSDFYNNMLADFAAEDAKKLAKEEEAKKMAKKGP